MARTISWSGRTWIVRPDSIGTAPGPNAWSDSTRAVEVIDGKLHLRIVNENGWKCAEVHHEKALGFGVYRWKITSPCQDLDPEAVLGLFTYDWWAKETGAGEVDIEVAKWGVPQTTDVEYSVQPVAEELATRNKRVAIAGPPYDCWINWMPDEIRFGFRDRKRNDHRWTTANVPPPPSDTTWPFLNLWLNRGRAPARGREIEVVLSSFSHTPH